MNNGAIAMQLLLSQRCQCRLLHRGLTLQQIFARLLHGNGCIIASGAPTQFAIAARSISLANETSWFRLPISEDMVVTGSHAKLVKTVAFECSLLEV